MKLLLLATTVLAAVQLPSPMMDLCYKSSKEYASSTKWLQSQKVILSENILKFSSLTPSSSLTKLTEICDSGSYLLRQSLSENSGSNLDRKLQIIEMLKEKNLFPFTSQCYKSSHKGYLLVKPIEGLQSFNLYKFIDLSLMDRLEFYMEMTIKMQWFNKHQIVFPFLDYDDINFSQDYKTVYIFSVQETYKNKEVVAFNMGVAVPPEVMVFVKAQTESDAKKQNEIVYQAPASLSWNGWRLLKLIADTESYSRMYSTTSTSKKGNIATIYGQLSAFILNELQKSADLRADTNAIRAELEKVYKQIRDVTESALIKKADNSKPLLRPRSKSA